ncbi:T9SS type A sorting domain-containing protein [Chryseobacterium sp. Tr-659]|uniref:T9SS type A sorting domain-containing protein n=1 Tax=Chryseobacterium sp. Tr-659 TaxID=2608340 RepID=UPI00141E11C3|nr:T9SS type A sorting domain-containing protein [Chryseobacterium sp. Tr-659]NIF04069.1 T9SS type A sorting domain-containing protein [Chryseobacterium sp. Tr-659]
MKKIFTVLTALAAFTFSNAQNLITNGGLETWTDPSVKPDGWFSMAGGSKETSIVHSGNNSIKLSPVSVSTNGNLDYVDVAVSENTDYTISYWILDNDTNARGRHWIQFRTATANISPASGNPFQPAAYSTDNANWVNVTATATTLPGTTILRVSLRVYAQNNVTTGAIYFDDIVLAQAGTLGTKNPDILKNSVKLSNTLVKNSFYLYLTGNAEVKLVSAAGQLFETKKVRDFATFDASKLPVGVNFVQIYQNGNVIVKKILKQ